MGQALSPADLIINPDGSIYHLSLLPDDVAETIITVGDPERVSEVSKHLDRIELKKGRREFLTHTGYLGKKRITIISTGIGTDNIDIVFNELDALVNIDFQTRIIKQKLTSLNIVRIGTSGAVQSDVPMGTILASSFGIGLDSLMQYYQHQPLGDESMILNRFKSHMAQLNGVSPYIAAADPGLLTQIGAEMQQGITVTAPGFYAPQGRQVRAKNKVPDLIGMLSSFSHKTNNQAKEFRITNLEMETAGIYALAGILGHKALSVSAILANRVNQNFSPDPAASVQKAIKLVFDKL